MGVCSRANAPVPRAYNFFHFYQWHRAIDLKSKGEGLYNDDGLSSYLYSGVPGSHRRSCEVGTLYILLGVSEVT